jgi:hypothetical protein
MSTNQRVYFIFIYLFIFIFSLKIWEIKTLLLKGWNIN